MSLAHLMDEKRDNDRKVKSTKSKRSSFWSGVLEGISGPLMMATRPQGRVHVKIVESDGEFVVASVENSFHNVGEAMRHAAGKTAVERGLKITKRPIKVLGADGKTYVYYSKGVSKRGSDGTQE